MAEARPLGRAPFPGMSQRKHHPDWLDAVKLMSRTKDQIEAENKLLRTEYGELFDSVAEVLFRHDPIGINFTHNTDEYYPEVRTILPKSKTCTSAKEVMSVVHQEFLKWLGSDLAGPEDVYLRIAEEVWALYSQREGRSRDFDTD